MARGLREAIGSILCVAIVLGVLVSMDQRVHMRVADLLGDPIEGGQTIGARVGDLAYTLWLAARDQSLDHGPLLVFTVAGAVLVLFMLRT